MSDELTVKFTADIADLKAGVGDVKRELSGIQDSAKGLSFIEAGESIKGLGRDLTQNVTMPVLGFFQESINAASSTQEAISKFAVIFDEVAGKGENWIATTAEKMSRSTSQIRDYAAGFGALLSPAFKENKEKALELSEGYTQLAIDLAAFYDTADEEAFVALRSGLAGEMEPLKRFGVLLTQDKVNAELMAMGVGKVASALTASQKAEIDSAQVAEDRAKMTLKALEATGTATEEELKSAKAILNSASAQNELVQLKYKAAIASDKAAAKQKDVNKIATDAEKAQARYNIIMRETVDAQGQATRESGGYAQQMKSMMAAVEEIKVEIGMALMPVIMQIIGILKQGLAVFKNLPPSVRPIIVVILGLAAALGPLLVILGTVIGSFGSLIAVVGTGGLTAAFGGLVAAISPVIVPILAIVGAIGLLVGGFVLAYKNSESFRTALGTIAGLIMGVLKGAVEWMIGGFKALITALGPVFTIIGDLLGGLVDKVATWVRGDGQSFIEMLQGLASIVGGVLYEAFKLYVGYVTEYFLPFVEWLIGGALDILLGLLTAIGDFFANPSVQGALKVIGTGLGIIVTALLELGKAIGGFILDNLGRFGKAAEGVAKFLSGDMMGAVDSFKDAMFETGEESGTMAESVAGNMARVSGSTATEMEKAKVAATVAAREIKDNLKKEYEENVKNVDVQMEKARLGMDNELGLTAKTADTRGKEIKDNLKKEYEKNVENADIAFEKAKEKIDEKLVETDTTVVQPRGRAIIASMGKTWEGVRTDAGERWDEIRTTVGEWVENVRVHIASWEEAYVETKARIWQSINDAVGASWSTIQSTVGGWVESVRAHIETYKQAYVDTKARIWAAIDAGVGPAWQFIRTTVGTATEGVRSHVESFKQSYVDTVGRIWGAIRDNVPSGWSPIISAVESAASNLVNRAAGVLGGLVDRARGIWDQIKGIFSQTVEIKPPVTPAVVSPSGARIDDHRDNQSGGRWVDGHYISPGATGYWTKDGEWVRVYHGGGVYDAPPGRDEGLAMLQEGEVILSRAQARALGQETPRSVTIDIDINNPVQKSTRESLRDARLISRKMVRRVTTA